MAYISSVKICTYKRIRELLEKLESKLSIYIFSLSILPQNHHIVAAVVFYYFYIYKSIKKVP